MTGTYREHTWKPPLPELRPLEACPCQSLRLPCRVLLAAVFPDLESRNPNRLHLISFRLTRTRAQGRSPVQPMRRPRRCKERGGSLFFRPRVEQFQLVAPDLFRAHARMRAAEGARPSIQCIGRAAAAGHAQLNKSRQARRRRATANSEQPYSVRGKKGGNFRGCQFQL